MIKKTLFISSLAGLLLVLSLNSCREDISIDENATVRFDTDTLHFDTVFTQQTRATLRTKIFNTSTKAVKINSIRLDQGENSFWRFAIDGQTGYLVEDVTLLPSDSAYIFLTLKVDPNNDSIPFIVYDRLIAETDAGTSTLELDAYGQNAYYYKDSVIGNIRWTGEKPIVLLGNVLVEEGTKLTIDPGCRIYSQGAAYLIVDGTLEAIGTLDDSITFQGNRLDRDYFNGIDNPGEWGGIYLSKLSVDNVLEHVHIRNAVTGIRVDSLSNNQNPKLRIAKSVIHNSLSQGILGINASLNMTNCLLSSNNVNLAFAYGGDLYMNHCTLAGYSVPRNAHTSQYKSISLQLYNYLVVQNIPYDKDLKARIYNSIIYGSLEEEASIDKISAATFDVEIYNSLLKTAKSNAELQALMPVFNNNILNQDPGFEDPAKRDYTFGSSSPAYRFVTSFLLFDDILDKIRSNPTDIGCREMD